MAEVNSGAAGEWKKYQEYGVEVDADQDDRATEIKLCQFSRPHMRAFHCSWSGFFIAFFIWFAVAPLLGEIRDDLNLTTKQVWTSSIVGVGGTIFMRFLLGPLNDKYGPRILMGSVLIAASIPTACTGFVNNAIGLAILRLFIGAAGGTFVMCQYWASRMFTKQVVGTANALCAGWGNLGGGVTQLVMGSGLFPLFKVIFDGDSEKAWRSVSVVPSIVAVLLGVFIIKCSDDSPKGNYWEMKQNGVMADVSAAASFRDGALNVNTWLLFIQYACCFGVELTMNNAAALYFRDVFELNTEKAAAIASIFGWMNLFARGLGGLLSDKMNASMGMKGRIWAQTVCLFFEGALVLVFANTKTLGSAIAVMVFFSLFVQAAEGTSYGIVPYVDPPATGSISGIVGAGGNSGAVGFGLGFRNLPDYKTAFMLMGGCIMASSLLSAFVIIPGHAGIFCGKDEVSVEKQGQSLSVPTANAGDKDAVNEVEA